MADRINPAPAPMPVPHNPWRAETVRRERRTPRMYRDPTGQDAAGNVDKERKKK